MSLLGNYNVFNKTPGRFRAGNSQCDRSNWNTSGSSRGFYYGDESVVKTAASVMITTHPLFTYGIVGGGCPPYSWIIPQIAGGMVLRTIGSGTLSMNLIPQYPMLLAMTGSGVIAMNIIGIGNLTASLLGTNTWSASLTAGGNVSIDLNGTSILAADIEGNGNIILALTGNGLLTGDASLYLQMLCDMIGSGILAADASLLVSMLCDMIGGSTLSMSIIGQYPMSIDLTGTGDLSTDMTAFANMLLDLIGTASMSMNISALAEMSIDITVTGTGLTTSNVGAAVWAALESLNNDPGTMGQLLHNASSAGDPWSTTLPGTYTGDQAGAIVDRLETLIKQVKALTSANL